MIEVKRFVQALEQGIQVHIAQRNAQLGKGQCASMEEYKLKVGENRGLEVAAGLARDMLRQMEIAEEGDLQGQVAGGQQGAAQ
jgi:hypothetical protein